MIVIVAVFLGSYLMRVNNAFLAAGITVALSQLYIQFNEYSNGLLLLLRLEETAIGCGIAGATVILLLPLYYTAVLRAALAAYVCGLSELMGAVIDALPGPSAGSDGDTAPLAALRTRARAADAAYQALRAAAHPLSRHPRRPHTRKRADRKSLRCGSWALTDVEASQNGGAVVKAVRFDRYGGVNVLEVVDVPRPKPGPGEVLVAVKAAGINPGETKIREGLYPATFPSGEGSDLAGIAEQAGPGVTEFAVGDEVIGFTDKRASHAEYVLVEARNLTHKPVAVPWDVAGALYVAGVTAWAAVRAVAPGPKDTVVISGAAGGVGSIAVQLAKGTRATVVGLASPENHEWLRAHGVIPVSYGVVVFEQVFAGVEVLRFDGLLRPWRCAW